MWLHIPSEFLASAQASACSKKDCVRAWRILESPAVLSFTSKGKPLLPRSWRRLCKRAVWTMRLSGTISRPSTAGRGVAAWIASLPVSPASRGASPASKPDRTITAGSGPTSRESFARLNLRFASSKTSRDLFKAADSNPSYLTLPKAGSMRSGVILKRAPLALRTSASECSSWPTARATDGEKGGPNQRGSRGDPTLPGMTALWATPDANTSTYSNGVYGQNLREQTTLWSSPNAHDGRRPGADMHSTQGANLSRDAATWSTPHANRSTGAGSTGRDGGLNLQSQVAMWPTPAARDHKGANSTDHVTGTGGGRKHMGQLANFVEHSPLVPQTSVGSPSSPSDHGSRPRLNPAFGCWLQGWPCWWTNRGLTNSVKLEMASWRLKQQRLLQVLLGER